MSDARVPEVSDHPFVPYPHGTVSDPWCHRCGKQMSRHGAYDPDAKEQAEFMDLGMCKCGCFAWVRTPHYPEWRCTYCKEPHPLQRAEGVSA